MSVGVEALLHRNATWADQRSPEPGADPPATVVVSCSDPRTDPASFLGLRHGEAMVVRTAGGRVSDAVLGELEAVLHLLRSGLGEGFSMDVLVVHHTACGAAAFTDPDLAASYRVRAGERALDLGRLALSDPVESVREDVARLRGAGIAGVGRVVGAVLDLGDGRLRTTAEAVVEVAR